MNLILNDYQEKVDDDNTVCEPDGLVWQLLLSTLLLVLVCNCFIHWCQNSKRKNQLKILNFKSHKMENIHIKTRDFFTLDLLCFFLIFHSQCCSSMSDMSVDKNIMSLIKTDYNFPNGPMIFTIGWQK